MKAKTILADNLSRAMKLGSVKTRSQLGLKTASGVAQATIGRILRSETDATIDTVQALARALDLEGWHLLVPDLDPKNPPSLKKMTLEGEDLASEVAKVLKKYAKTNS
jgi:transcriptional regulator with XRE-family HTH domain